jgi:uncharacterized protein
MNKKKLKEKVFYTKGLHCASCEVLVEKKLLQIDHIKAVEANACENKAKVAFTGKPPLVKKLNKMFKKEGYRFSSKPFKGENKKTPLVCYDKEKKLVLNKSRFSQIFKTGSLVLLLIFLFLLLQKSSLSSLLSVNSASSLPAFFVFGLLAGFSTCSALVGGIILSMSKQWGEVYGGSGLFLDRLKPHLLFNGGRLLSYFVLGSLLGVLGSVFSFSLTFTSLLTVAVSLLMFFLGLQMLGVPGLQKIKVRMPKFTSRFIADEANFKGRFLPFLMGGLTFFLPCGFTLTAQSLALVSGSFWQAGLIMFVFALGTLPALFLIGFSSVKFMEKKHLSRYFLPVAGVLVLFFAVYNINAQLNVLGFKSLTDFTPSLLASSDSGEVADLPKIVNGKQVVKTEAGAYAYTPSTFKVRAGVPVRWEITDVGTSGCTNAIISRDLFEGEIPLTPGKVSVKEFTPQEPGRYKYSCWMGMVSGVIEVVDSTGSVGNNKVIDSAPSQGCGGGCSGSCGGGCGNPNCVYSQ